jgi:two-component system, OmpR family, sensor histidine kinase KdpD
MSDATLRLSEKSRDVNWTVAGILGLLIITVLATVPLTLTILQNRDSDALVIDMAGRQRMLLERYMKELLLASQGVSAQPERTRVVLQERLKALLNGGSTDGHVDRRGNVVLPEAPTEEIRLKLLEQQHLLDAFQSKAEQFLQALPNATGYEAMRNELFKDNAVLLESANDAVTLFAQHSDAHIRALIRWEILVVLLVVTVASLQTWRFLRAEKELKKSQAMTVEALRQSDALKSSLLSSVSHELKTPLTAIKTLLFALCGDERAVSESTRKEVLDGVNQEIDYLNHVVDNLLDMSRIEAGTLRPRREWHLLEELVEGAIRRMEERLRERRLDVELPNGLPPIFVDGTELQLVVLNLLDNASKYSPVGSHINLRASLVGDMLEVRVSNVGEGIPADALVRIFDRFYRGQTAQECRVPGTGLGLAICKGIIEAHGGQIMAESTPGQETTISFRVPVTGDAGDPSASGTATALYGARV